MRSQAWCGNNGQHLQQMSTRPRGHDGDADERYDLPPCDAMVALGDGLFSDSAIGYGAPCWDAFDMDEMLSDWLPFQEHELEYECSLMPRDLYAIMEVDTEDECDSSSGGRSIDDSSCCEAEDDGQLSTRLPPSRRLVSPGGNSKPQARTDDECDCLDNSGCCEAEDHGQTSSRLPDPRRLASLERDVTRPVGLEVARMTPEADKPVAATGPPTCVHVQDVRLEAHATVERERAAAVRLQAQWRTHRGLSRAEHLTTERKERVSAPNYTTHACDEPSSPPWRKQQLIESSHSPDAVEKRDDVVTPTSARVTRRRRPASSSASESTKAPHSYRGRPRPQTADTTLGADDGTAARHAIAESLILESPSRPPRYLDALPLPKLPTSLTVPRAITPRGAMLRIAAPKASSWTAPHVGRLARGRGTTSPSPSPRKPLSKKLKGVHRGEYGYWQVDVGATVDTRARTCW